MLLAIDAGNSRTKWAVFDAQGEILEQGVCANALFSSASLPLETVTRVFISNVAGKAHAAALQIALSEHHLQPEWLKSQSHCNNVMNHYLQPETLGTDRWASLIAAWEMQHMPCVVVNAGTAITIDALLPAANNPAQAEFIGGMILPGLNLMQASLDNAADQLSYQENVSNMDGNPFNTKTADAMRNGALNAACGAIQNMLATLNKTYHTHACVMVSGGDAQVIQKHLSKHMENQVIFVDNLVLRGLYFIYRAQSQQSGKQ